MEIGAILVGSAMLVGTIPFLLNPFQKESAPAKLSGDGRPSPEPESDRTAILIAIRDLDFDYRLGKVSDEDYAALRAQLIQEAARLPGLEDINDPLEALIRERRSALKRPGEKLCPNCKTVIQSGDHYCRRCGIAIREDTCPGCQQPIHPGDTYCSACGRSLTPTPSKPQGSQTSA